VIDREYLVQGCHTEPSPQPYYAHCQTETSRTERSSWWRCRNCLENCSFQDLVTDVQVVVALPELRDAAYWHGYNMYNDFLLGFFWLQVNLLTRSKQQRRASCYRLHAAAANVHSSILLESEKIYLWLVLRWQMRRLPMNVERSLDDGSERKTEP